MFKAYQPPRPEGEDWTDQLLSKGLPLAAGVGAALAAVPTGGMSLAALPAVMGAGATGLGLGQAAAGALSSKPGSEARMYQGLGTAGQGAAVWGQTNPDTGAFKTKDYGKPQTKDTQAKDPQTADPLEAAKEKATSFTYSSPYAAGFNRKA